MTDDQNGNGKLRTNVKQIVDEWLDGILGKGVRTIIVPAMLVALINSEFRQSQVIQQAAPLDLYQQLGDLTKAVGQLEKSFKDLNLAVVGHDQKVDVDLNGIHSQITTIAHRVSELEQQPKIPVPP